MLLWSFPELFLPAVPSPKALTLTSSCSGASLMFAYGKEQFPPSVSTAVAQGAGLPVLCPCCSTPAHGSTASSPAPLSLSLEGADSQSLSLCCAQGAGQWCELSPPLLWCEGSREFANPGRACDTQLMTFSLPVFPLRQKSECLLSLEAYSQEQKKRICWCLAENITKQQHPAAAPTESKVRDPQRSWKSLPGARQGFAR